ncbi:hypothetical protein E2562_039462 [Oryza meyeriana var. granulata]|uniref:EF-hand domain-containing protein n=1 Tax=Oryza meyeriana var. granulata TaxID=110450 RepID=A0A6G1FH47_9ORYZ|nr:hypothetical protein E2562_039462 [Oryza meyeriana var. granulata]
MPISSRLYAFLRHNAASHTLPCLPLAVQPAASPASGGRNDEPRRGGAASMAGDQAELRRVFELFDRDGDGRITREELTESLERLGMPVQGEELATTIARIDANGDGCVDMDEFAELYESVMRVDGGGDEEEAGMREAFDVFDRNGDGFITVDELRAGRTLEDCGRMIGQVDRDGDGRIDFLEFKQMMRGGGFSTLR